MCQLEGMNRNCSTAWWGAACYYHVAYVHPSPRLLCRTKCVDWVVLDKKTQLQNSSRFSIYQFEYEINLCGSPTLLCRTNPLNVFTSSEFKPYIRHGEKQLGGRIAVSGTSIQTIRYVMCISASSYECNKRKDQYIIPCTTNLKAASKPEHRA